MDKYIWILLGLVVLALPLLVPMKLTIFYGLLGVFTTFSWSADRYNKNGKEWRGIVGSAIVFVVPFVWDWVTTSWVAVFAFPTIGSFIAAAVVWGIFGKK